MIVGHRVVRIFGGESYESDRAVAAANRLRVAMSKESAAAAASSPLTVFLAACAVGLIIAVALAQSESGSLDFALFLSYVVALLTLLDRLKGLSGINASIQRGLAAPRASSAFSTMKRNPIRGRLRSISAAVKSASIAYRYVIRATTARH